MKANSQKQRCLALRLLYFVAYLSSYREKAINALYELA